MAVLLPLQPTAALLGKAARENMFTYILSLDTKKYLSIDTMDLMFYVVVAVVVGFCLVCD